MATALKDLYSSGPEPFDQIILPEGYSPAESEEFMNPLQRAYFLHKLRSWKDAIVSESRGPTVSERKQRCSGHGMRRLDVSALEVDAAQVESKSAIAEVVERPIE